MHMGMVSLDACIYTIIAILSVAYPILLQVISRLDDKYSSIRAVSLFEEEPVRRWFVRCLIGSVTAVVIWFLCHLIPTTTTQAGSGSLSMVESLALGLVCLTTCGLLVFFFLLTHKTLTYYNAQKFSAYLQAAYRTNRQEYQHFEVLSDIFIAAITARNSSLTSNLAEFFSQQFAAERGEENQQVTYPAAYYQLVYRSTEALALLGNRKPMGLTHVAAGGGWLLDGQPIGKHSIITEATYTAIWHSLRTALDYGQDDMIYAYWSTADQYLQYRLQRVTQQYKKNAANQVANLKAIRLREQERARYLEFHHVLGAMLLYTGRRDLLRRLFDHTTSQPPRYPLLPEHMTEIFRLFVHYYHGNRLPPIDITYSFPNEAGLAAESLITKWLFTYLAVLFLRQYTLGRALMWDEPLAHPQLPEGQPAKKNWLDAIGLIRRYVTEVLQQEDLLRSLRLDFITEAWCRQKQVEYPLALLTAVEQELQLAYRQGADTVALSPAKVAEFYTDSGRILERTATRILHLTAPEKARTFIEAHYQQGRRRLVSKDEFAATSEIDHLNFSSALAEAMAHELENEVAHLFVRNQPIVYQVAQSEVFAALNKLEIGSDHVVINLGLNLSYIANQADVTDRQFDSYRGSEVIDFRAGSLPNSLLVMKRDELPAIRFLVPEQDEIKKYGLTEISQQAALYASVLDANYLSDVVEAEVRNGAFGAFAEERLEAQALEILWLTLEFKWQQNAKLVWLKAPYQQDGRVSDVETITAF